MLCYQALLFLSFYGGSREAEGIVFVEQFCLAKIILKKKSDYIVGDGMKSRKIKFMGVIGAIFILLSVATITPVVASQQTSAATTNIESETAKSASFNLPEEEKYKITSIIGKYTEKTKDGLLKITINDISNIPLSKEEIRLYEKGIEKLNKLASEGKIKIVKDKNGEYIGIPTEKIMNITIPKTYSEYIEWIKSLNLSSSEKKLLLNITENEWNNIAEKVATLSGAGGRGGGKNDFKISFHWYGVKYELWLDHYWTTMLWEYGIPLGVGVVFAIIGWAVGGPVGVAIMLAIASFIVAKIGSDAVRNADHGNGVKFTFKDYWWTPWVPIDWGIVKPQ